MKKITISTSTSRWTLFVGFVLVLITFFATQGCDSGTGIDPVTNHPGNMESSDQIRYVYGTYDSGEEHAVEVILDDDLTQERQTFASEEDYYDELDRLMEEDELVINTSLYHQFIHALYPAEIRLLDTAGEVVIGEYLFTTTEEASYKSLIDDPNSTPELEEYWDKDGQAVERELSEFVSLIGRPDVLSTKSFKNPFIQSQATEYINTAYESDPLLQHGKASGISLNYKHMDTTSSEISTVCLPSDRAEEADLSQWCYSVKFRYWNQSTHTKKRRARAGTEPMVSLDGVWVRLVDEGPPGLGSRLRLRVSAKGGHSTKTATCHGTLSVGSLDYSKNPPYSSILVTNCNSITVVANRKKRRGAESWHRHGFHEYYDPVTVVNGETQKTYLMYSPSKFWDGKEFYLK